MILPMPMYVCTRVLFPDDPTYADVCLYEGAVSRWSYLCRCMSVRGCCTPMILAPLSRVQLAPGWSAPGKLTRRWRRYKRGLQAHWLMDLIWCSDDFDLNVRPPNGFTFAYHLFSIVSNLNFLLRFLFAYDFGNTAHSAQCTQHKDVTIISYPDCHY